MSHESRGRELMAMGLIAIIAILAIVAVASITVTDGISISNSHEAFASKGNHGGDSNVQDQGQNNGNGKIAFVSDRDGNDEIYVMNEDGTNQTRLTDTNSFNANPSWSVAGTPNT